MAKATGIDHVVLHVSDLERSKLFYLDVLGMTVAHEGTGQVFLHCGNQMIALFQVSDAVKLEAGIDMNHLAVQTDTGTLESIKSELVERGINVTGRPGDPHCIYFSDPDGHRLQIVYPGGE